MCKDNAKIKAMGSVLMYQFTKTEIEEQTIHLRSNNTKLTEILKVTPALVTYTHCRQS